MRSTIGKATPIALVSLLAILAFGASSALAATPVYTVDTVDLPSNLPPGGEGRILLEVDNLGDAPARGETSPIVVADKLPQGLTAVAATIRGFEVNAPCELGTTVTCEDPKALAPYAIMNIEITVEVAERPPASIVNEVSVSGGGAAGVLARRALTASSAPVRFGVENFKQVATNEDGSADTQAGSHPFQLTTTFDITDGFGFRVGEYPGQPQPAGLAKDLSFDLPPGLVGNPQVLPQCTTSQFDTLREDGFNGCPADTAIGVAIVLGSSLPVFNLVPSPGEPARFGFEIEHAPVILDTTVRTGGDYGVTVNVNNISNFISLPGSQVTFWGVPGDSRHDSARGWECLYDQSAAGGVEEFPCSRPAQPTLTPFLTLPTSCTGPNGMLTTVHADSWEEPGVFRSAEDLLREGAGEPLGMTGCDRLPFGPSISVAPDGQEASTPTGLTVGVHVPQAGALNPTGLSPADVKDTTVTLPAGVQISPAGADGLEACSLLEGLEPLKEEREGKAEEPGINLETSQPADCPDGSKVATAEIKTPLLPNPLTGEVYLAAQNANPFGSLVAMYIVAKDPVSGVLVKLAGQVTLDPVTGQLVSTFKETPQLPFEDLSLHFFGSARAPLSTPALCGSYTTTTSITPWSGNAPAEPSSTFQITSGPNGAPCSNPRPFAPGFNAETTNIQAGAFTPFQLTMTRPDADQTLSRVEMSLPPGLLGTLSHVKLCGEPQAAQGACGPESLIGETTVSAGLGNDPFTVTGGRVYITEKYGGGEYGLSIVNPAKAGPFDLEDTPENHPACDCIVVRAAVSVDPHTAALSIRSDPLPTIVDGIPLQIQHVNVTVDRAGGDLNHFTFNPTNCNKTAIGGTLTSSEGATAPVSTSFQVTNCERLAFKPKFAVSTAGKTSKAKGASLHVKLTYPQGPNYANIARVKVDLPKQLPSRLTTLQKACTAAQFEANPAGCPAASIIGHAKAITPILPVALEGPAYFVSHGGEAFPSLIVVLKGYGTTVDLVGTTFISKAGITSSTFKTVPDVPVGSFELNLPQGKYSALAANGSLCKSAGKLKMPTEFVAQNGAVIHQSTPIAVSGCPKAHKAKKKAKKKKKSKKNSKSKGKKK